MGAALRSLRNCNSLRSCEAAAMLAESRYIGRCVVAMALKPGRDVTPEVAEMLADGTLYPEWERMMTRNGLSTAGENAWNLWLACVAAYTGYMTGDEE